MKIGKYVLTMVLALACAGVFAQENSNAGTWELWNSGYEHYERAKRAKNQKRYREAKENLEKAREFYSEVKRTRPDWNQKVIDNRIALVDSDLAVLETLLAGEGGSTPAQKAETTVKPEQTQPAAAPPPAELPPPPKALAERQEARSAETLRKLAEVSDERDLYRKRVSELTRELESARIRERANAASLEEIENLLAENRRAAERVAQLEQEKRIITEKLAKPDEEKEQLKQLLVEEKIKEDELRKLLTEANARAEKLRADASGVYAERSQLKTQLAELENKLTLTGGELSELRNRNVFDKAERDALETKLAAATGESKRLAAELEKQNSQLAELREKYDATLQNPAMNGTEAAELLKINLELSEALHQLQLDHRKLADQNRELEKSASEASSEAADLKKYLYDLETGRRTASEESRINRERAENEAKRADAAELSAKELETRAENLRESVLKLTRENDELKKRAASGAGNAAQLAELTRENQSLTDRLRELDRELEELRLYSSNRDTLAANLTTRLTEAEKSAAELSAARNKLEDLTNQLEVGDKRIKNLTRENNALARENGQLKLQLENTEVSAKIRAEAEAGANELRAELTATQRRNQELVAEVEGEKRAAAKVQAESARRQDQLADRVTALAAQNDLLREALNNLQKTNASAPAVAEEFPELEPLPSSAGKRIKAAELAAEAAAAETPELALYCLREANDLTPNDPDVSADLGLLEYSIGDRDRAEKLLATAAAAYPGHATIATPYAELLMESGRYGNALLVTENALAENPENYELLLLRANALAKIGSTAEALERLDDLAAGHPERGEARIAKAELIYRTSRPEAAALYSQGKQLSGKVSALLEKELAGELAANAETAGFLLAAINEAEAVGEWEAAMWFCRELCNDVAPFSHRARAELAYTLLRLGLPEEAAKVVSPAATRGDHVMNILALAAADRASALAYSVPESAADPEPMEEFYAKILAYTALLEDGDLLAKLTAIALPEAENAP